MFKILFRNSDGNTRSLSRWRWLLNGKSWTIVRRYRFCFTSSSTVVMLFKSWKYPVSFVCELSIARSRLRFLRLDLLNRSLLYFWTIVVWAVQSVRDASPENFSEMVPTSSGAMSDTKSAKLTSLSTDSINDIGMSAVMLMSFFF